VAGTEVRLRFPRRLRLLRRNDFQLVYKRGQRRFGAHMTLFYLRRSESGAARFGFSVAKHLGSAVERNRIKRRLREVVRLHRPQLAGPVDVVINPKKSALQADFSELQSEIGVALGIIEKSIQKRA